MFNKFLIPLDGAPQAESALECALAMSGRSDASLNLLTVVAGHSRRPSSDTERGEAEEYLDGVRHRLELPPDLVATVRIGDPATEILAEARTARADLIMLPDRSSGGRSEGDLGRVTSRVLLGSPVPVLVYRGGENSNPPSRDVMVLLDGSRLSEEVIGPAVEIAHLCGGRLTLATVLEPPSSQFGNNEARWCARRVGDHERAQRYLDRLKSSCSGQGLEVDTKIVSGEFSALLDNPGSATSTILAMTTRGASGFSRWVLGGVADRITREFQAPALVIPPRMT